MGESYRSSCRRCAESTAATSRRWSAATDRRRSPVRVPRFARSHILAALALAGCGAALAVRAAGTPAPAGAGVRISAADGPYVLVDEWPLPPPLPAPLDVELDADGGLYVADGRHRRVVAYAPSGDIVATIDPPLGSEGQLVAPVAIAADTARQRVHIVWQVYDDTGSAPVPDSVYLEERGPSGEYVRPALAVSFAAEVSDVAVHPATGDLFVAVPDRVCRVRMPQRMLAACFDAAVARTPRTRLAATSDDRVVVVDVAGGKLAVHREDGTFAGEIATASVSPVAVAADEGGGVIALVRATDAGDPSADLVVRYDAAGTVTWRHNAGSLGAPSPPRGEWPWAVAARAGRVAFTSADHRFRVRSVDERGSTLLALPGAPVDARYVARADDPRAATVLGLAAGPAGSVVVADGAEGRLLEFQADGAAELSGILPVGAVDLAAGPDGEKYVSTSTGAIWRLPKADAAAPDWVSDAGSRLGSRLAASARTVFAAMPDERALRAIDVASSTVARGWRAPAGPGLWPSDIALTDDGRVLTADLVAGEVQAWGDSDEPLGTWAAGLLAGPRRIAAGRTSDGTAVAAAIMADGFVEVHATADGNLLTRWRPMRHGGAPIDAVDIALGAADSIVLADARARMLYAFAPSPRSTPTTAPMPSPTATVSSRACLVSGDKVAEPARVVLGEAVTVTLRLSAECPGGTRKIGADIVLVLDRSGSMRGPKLAAAQGAARTFAELLDVRSHRLALVTFSSEPRADAPLTSDSASVVRAVEAVQADPQGQTDLSGALETARRMLATSARPDALPVAVLLTDGRHNRTAVEPRDVAAEARADGIRIYAIGLGADADAPMLEDVAGDPGRYFHAPGPSELFPIYDQVLRLVVASMAGNLLVEDEIASDMTYEPGSARPDALAGDGRLRWGRSLLPSDGVSFRYRLRPERGGCLPTNREARADYTDGDGVSRRFVFPVPTVCAVTPTSVPAPTRTPAPTATIRPSPAYLPIALTHRCVPGVVHADVVLLVDTSESMAGAKLAAAKSAAHAFVGYLDLASDRAAVIGFDARPVMSAPLTGDRILLESAISRLATSPGTVIDAALRAAASELLSSRHRPGNRRVIALLSDGGHNGPADEVLRVATEATGQGIAIYAIGLGADADRALLARVSGAGRFYFAPTVDELAGIYRGIAIAIPCP